MHNAELPESMRRPVFEDHGTSQRWKITIFKDYKYPSTLILFIYLLISTFLSMSLYLRTIMSPIM